jgi:hypothetical protein
MGVKELERAKIRFKGAVKKQTDARLDANAARIVAEFSRKAAKKAWKLEEVAAEQRFAAEKELDHEMRIVEREVFGSSEESSEANNELARTVNVIHSVCFEEMSREEGWKKQEEWMRLEKKRNSDGVPLPKESNDEQIKKKIKSWANMLDTLPYLQRWPPSLDSVALDPDAMDHDH